MSYKALAALATITLHEISPVQVEQFLAGIVEGLIQKNDFAEIQVCLVDQVGLVGEITTAIEDFKKGDMFSILAGVQEMGVILQEIPADLGDCVAMKPDVDRIEVWAAIFKDPKALIATVIRNSMFHLAEIGADISQAVTDILADDFMAVGNDIADLLVLQLGPVPELKSETDLMPEYIIITEW